ncbi:SelL-related redox protein [Planctomicrobium sp.]|nr:SelL-related redox protein [Planctomicrobium sp.]MBT5020685.1 redoxin domain-containing protein [Planctomicrobium sp.]MDB4733628.1 SelL-related redox protein [Planctomicrobium sp.]MDB4743439.1 SelL-related redox protein [Planctomicrobium sp.]
MTESDNNLTAPFWMTFILKFAGIYNLCWGAWVVLFPLSSLKLCGYHLPPTYPELWQCIGMIVGVYGIGYWLAASDPYRHWPIVLVGLLGKIFGPIGFILAWMNGSLPLSAGIVNIFNDLIWLVPFIIILWRALRHEQIQHSESKDLLSFQDALKTFKSQQGQTLADLSQQQRTMLVFLRHSGCTFCREALAEIAQHRPEIEKNGTQIAFVHMDTEEHGRQLFERYLLSDLPRFSDPEEKLYRAANIGLGRWYQLLSCQVFWKGFQSAILKRHGFSRIRSNVFRMPGTILIENGQIVKRYDPQDASDHPDYCSFG